METLRTGVKMDLSLKTRNEASNPAESHSHMEAGANIKKQKSQITFNERLEVRKGDTAMSTILREPLKNGKDQEGRYLHIESKSGEAFQKDSYSSSSDADPMCPYKSAYNEELSFRKPTDVRGSESSLNSKTSTCTSLCPVIENSKENSSDTGEASRMSRENSPRESMDEALKSEKAFIEYVMSLPNSLSLIHRESPSVERMSKPKQQQHSAVTSPTKVGLDHLDNLCKLMEQLSDLKETNTKLQKRVQYLEDLKTLNDMHKEIRQDSQYGSSNILARKKHVGLRKSMTSGDCVKHSPRGSEDLTGTPTGMTVTSALASNRDQRQSTHRGRTTHSSVGDGRRRERSKSVGHEDAFDGKSKRIFPRWSKVKEALGWERSLPEDNVRHQPAGYCSDTKDTESKTKSSVKNRDSGNSSFFKGNRRVFTEDYVANLGIPYYVDYAEKEDESPSDSLPGCDLWKPNPNFHSSSEDVSQFVDAYRTTRGNSKRDSDSSAKRLSLLEPPSEGIKRQKSTPSPGSEGCRSYHEMLDLKPKSLTIERDIDAEQAFAKFEKEDGKKSHKSPWGRVKTIIERRRDSLKQKHFRRGPEPEPSSPMQSRVMDLPCTVHSVDDLDYQSQEGLFQRKASDDQLVMRGNYSDFLPKNVRDETECRRKLQQECSHSKEKDDEDVIYPDTAVPPLRCSKSVPNQSCSQFYEVLPPDSRCVSIGGGEYPTPNSSPQFHRKSRWMRMKNAFRGKKEGECGEPSSLSMPASPNGAHDSTFDFEDNDVLYGNNGVGKLADSQESSENKGRCHDAENCSQSREMTRVGSDSFVHKLSLSSSAPITDIMLELQRNLSEDFNRKIVEWERIRSVGGGRTISPKWDRKGSEPKTRSKKQDKSKPDRVEKTTKPKIKDLSWLEKELQKIEKEKLRLSKEKEKYEERAVRLERLRQTVLNAKNSNKQEVFVRTSAGEFRFEGISDAFTKKLYEWETKRGVCPESSTIALLDSSFGSSNKTGLTIPPMEKCNLLHRAMSRSESSLPEMGQPSHTSSNSLPSLKPPDAGDIERIQLQSRANSEPDLLSLSAAAAAANGTNNRNGICLKPFENASVNDVFTKEENSRDSSCDFDKNPDENYSPPGVPQLITSYNESDPRDEVENEQREENYYSLLEENVILLEQLKKKEEICRRLETELELLDEKVDEMNSHHQKEMERYREKLWEMHRPGTTPREAQGCLQIISELRTRIEELEKCSERLRNDRDTIEDSFRYHSEQQDHMTRDLLNKMRELQAAGGSPVSESAPADECEFKRSKQKLLPIMDMKIVDKLQSLSAQLVKQTTDLENTLAERTRQICQLRWELLHRDVSTVKLETELHTAHIQGAQHPCRTKCEAKRSKYAHFRSWSSEEASSRAKQQEERYPEFDKLVHQSQEVYNHIPKSEFQATDLSCTVHELSKELLRLSTAAESLLMATEDEDQPDRLAPAKTENAVQKRKLSESEMEQSTNGPDPCLRGNSISNFGRKQGADDSTCSSQITVRRNSADNISSVSGPDGSETSSLNDTADKAVPPVITRTLPPKRRVSISSSSSEESSDEERFSSASCFANKEKTAGVQGKEIILRRGSSRKEHKSLESTKGNYGKYVSLDTRVTNSDSKIPLANNFNIVKSGSVGSYDRNKKEVKQADRSLSAREKRELFVNRREHILRRRMKPPPLEIKTIESLTGRQQWGRDSLKSTKEIARDKTNFDTNEISTSTVSTELSYKNVNSVTSCKLQKEPDSRTDIASLPVVTIKIPRKKSKTTPKKTQSKSSQVNDSNKTEGTVMETVTVVLPKKKRSVDRQLPKRSSTDGDIRKLVAHESAPISNCNAELQTTENDKCGKRDVHVKENQCSSKTESVLRLKNVDGSTTSQINNRAQHTVTASEQDSVRDSDQNHFTNTNDSKSEIAQEETEKFENLSPLNIRFQEKTPNSPHDPEQQSFGRSGYFKSPSAPQLDWRKTCAKKTSREDAPNVKCLIERYNKKVTETRFPKLPRPPYNSAIPVRKTSAMDYTNQQDQTNIPLASDNKRTNSSPSSAESGSSPVHRSPDITDKLHSPPLSPPMSPASRARAAALLKAKENFMSTNTVQSQLCTPTEKDENDRPMEYSTVDPSIQSEETVPKNSLRDEDRASSSSTRSMDSMSLVICRTGQSCQENRLARKQDSDKNRKANEDFQEKRPNSAQSISNPSLSRTVAGYEFKLPSSLMNLKIRRSKRKKDLATVSELCRQSLHLTKDDETSPCVDVNHRMKPTPRSCPSSPELKSKGKSKIGWLSWSILKHK